MREQSFVWDKWVRLSHWLVAAIVLLNLFITEEGEQTHQYLGYVAVTLVFIRIIWSLSWAKAPARFSDLIPTISGLKSHIKEIRQRQESSSHIGHNDFGLLAIWFMWFCIVGLGISGYLSDTDWGIDNDIDDIHELIANLLQAVVILHVFAVFLTSWWFKRSLLKAMIHK